MKIYQPGDRIRIRNRDRDQFMALAAGILLGRDRNGHIIVGDTEEAYLAMEHHGAGQEVHTGRHENNRVTKYGISGPGKSINIKSIIKSALVGIGCRMSPRWWPVCDAEMRTLHLGRC